MMVKVTGDNEVYHCQFDLTLWKPKQLTLRIVDFNLLCVEEAMMICIQNAFGLPDQDHETWR